MRITLANPYKSIISLPPIELPNFVVLTGVNGAGKSHFLQALELGHLRIDEIPHNPHTRNIRRFEWSNLVPNDSGTFAGFQAKQERSQMWGQLSSLAAQLTPQLKQLVSQHPALTKYSVKQLSLLKRDQLISDGFPEPEAESIINSIQATVKNLDQALSQQFIQQNPHNYPRFLSAIRAATSLNLIALEEEDFYENFPIAWQPVDMFQQSFARLFTEYQASYTQNKFKKFLNADNGENHRVLSEEDFIARYGVAPWDFVNEILHAANINFRINAPDKFDDRSYEPNLIDQTTGVEVKFNDLSSGEKVLMSFALCLYYARDSRQIVEYPQILLFDEIDAPLHPSMTQSLLRTIETVLINQHNIKVILTTHSPSTVALAPEESLYAMRKGVSDRLIKTSKDSALSILMSGVPTLSINYENRRQVFTESHYDAEFYEILYESLKPRLKAEVSLNFIAAGSSKNGGCAQVTNIVNELYEAGNRTVLGIIDWDRTNSNKTRIKVLGEHKRYSVENYIFDPILICALLFRERFIERQDIGLADKENHTDFENFANERLQNICDFVIGRLSPSIPEKSSHERVLCHYVGGASVLIPSWYLTIQGHELESMLKKEFGSLRSFHREGDLKRAVLKKVADEIPDLIPQCVLDLFVEIQNT